MLVRTLNSGRLWAQVKVKRRADDQKFLAQVLAIGTDCDIALLTVEDEAFWEGVTPLELGPLPTLQVHWKWKLQEVIWILQQCCACPFCD